MSAITHEQALDALDFIEGDNAADLLERYIAQQRAANDAIVRERDDAVAEAERLRGCLTQANANHEEFERKWYLTCDDRDRLREALEAISAAHLAQHEGPHDFAASLQDKARAALAGREG